MTTQTFSAPTVSLPRLLLYLEGFALFVGAIAVYTQQEGRLWLFLALLLVPDLSMVGYLRNPRIGALTYNLVHTYVVPAVFLALMFMIDSEIGVQTALIWFAHIGMDRMLGYGLKYPTEFKSTHLGRV
ncbi:MAG: DUF4260 family protein [Anaerolineae bacterium]|nr:DUF4260 family protein [Anaerolineae bacterium]